MEEEIQSMALCIEEEQEKKNKVKAEVEMINNVKDSKRMKVSPQRATHSRASQCYKKLISVTFDLIILFLSHQIWTKTEQLCEELTKVQESYGEQAYSPAYPLMILLQLEDWISDSLDLIENMPAERLYKIQKRICKHYEVR